MADAPALRIGFIGTGIMGGPMARRLAEAGFAVAAWNRSLAKTAALRPFGVVPATSPREAAGNADVLLCMLSSGPVCDEVIFGKSGAAEALRPGATVLVMSSIAPKEAREQAMKAAALGLGYVDAPVSGGEKGAKGGTLAIMAGGSAEAVERLGPVFAPLGHATHVGPAGSGSLAKLCNQLIVATTIGAVSEALLLAEQGGADPARVREALLGGFADSTILRQHGLRMVTGDFAPGGPAKYQIKDTGAALDAAASLGLDLPLAATVDRLFRSLVEHGGADLDHSALILELKRANGLAGERNGFSAGSPAVSGDSGGFPVADPANTRMAAEPSP
ncbi:3-hydroxyisobutyrate dehydrogenase [Aureimonas endophytica]|uniref:3-hydroxyisobutyrate dehydrogenase n=1 Tax=Aureimonas endophytica TaxID=2027858 RepID=A0A916ZMP7_9HYPH|nr:NAD(P)-dependent oxidoreductase [Aureimonas endophytica]GGE05253.1 3-hydroxyisobutyrate dehydrogenase [Aureimonas endophytica]